MKNLTVFVLVLGVCAMCAAALAQQTPMTETNPKAELRKSIESGKVLFKVLVTTMADDERIPVAW